jgi:hypothetical protein
VVDFPVPSPQPTAFPWRTAALVAAAVAAVELVVLVGVAARPLLADGGQTASPERATLKGAAQPGSTAPAAGGAASPASHPADLPRRKVRVVVLNGNGRQGAAAAASRRIEGRGYRIGLVGNAPSHDYPRSLVMYRPGFAGEARRLGRDLGIRLVSPLDGMRPGQLHGAHAVVVLGG